MSADKQQLTLIERAIQRAGGAAATDAASPLPRWPQPDVRRADGPRWSQAWAMAAVAMIVGAELTYLIMTSQPPDAVPPVHIPQEALRAMPAMKELPLIHAATSPATAEQPKPADPRTEIEATVATWAAAWSAKDLDLYLGFYASDFTPPGKMTRSSWQAQRHERILGKRKISVQVDDLSIELVDQQRAIVRFAQTYEADGYRELRAPKVLILAREGDMWRIAAEEAAKDGPRK